LSKKPVIDAIRNSTGMTTAQADQAIAVTFLGLRQALEAGSPSRGITIPGFGTFRRKFVDTRQSRNPKTGESVTVAAHYKISFKEPKGKR
jgi:DNA-binding protein HU-beta